MGSIPDELSLDLKRNYTPKTISEFLKEISTIGNVSEKLSKLNDYINSLEDEIRKIDVFKRELPLCMLIMKDAIESLKEESMKCKGKIVEPILEEFIPLKKDCNEEEESNNEVDGNGGKEDDSRDKKNWMSSVQLWNSEDVSTSDYTNNHKHNSKVESKKKEGDVNRSVIMEDPIREGRAFMPFKGYPGYPAIVAVRKEDKELPVHGLSLVTPVFKKSREESSSTHSKLSCSRVDVQTNLKSGPHLALQQHQQITRKQRRCWSPELHRRFVSALQQLGGTIAATPKQIRELMQVDGLTNDEVKSHLQKYRLHSRRVPSAAASAAAGAGASSTTNPSVVVLRGGMWMPQDHQYGESSKQSNSQSGSPEGPLQLAGNTRGTPSTTCCDDDDEDSMEDDNEKSDSYSWK